MKGSFKGYYRLSDKEITDLWNHCMFVFDANMLLNLYRYPQEARNDLLSVLKRVSDRIWIPYQAALEYQENRLNVIAEQLYKYREVREIVSGTQSQLHNQLENLQLKKKHSAINPDGLIKDVERIFQKFLEELKQLEQEQPNVFDHDKVRDEIDSIFETKVGPRPSSQEVLDQIYNEGRIRYEQKRPPGYKDDKKAKGDTTDYLYGGLTIRKEFGDLILWYQIIEQAKASDNFKSIIFVTDDNKEDWWWLTDSQGVKTIGPRPELVEEIWNKAGATFYMYNSERFLSFAKDHLGVQVKPESIDQVREVTLISRKPNIGSLVQLGQATERAVLKWLEDKYPEDQLTYNPVGFPDIIRIAEEGNLKIGYQVRLIREPRYIIHHSVRESVYRAYYEVSEGNYSEICMVLVTDDVEKIGEITRLLDNPRFNIPKSIPIFIGVLKSDEKGEELVELTRYLIQPSLFEFKKSFN